MDRKEDDDLIERLKEVFNNVMPPSPLGEYPEEALPLGTYVRSTRFNQLGVITDAFYGELDADNQKIIIYTILLFPTSDPLARMTTKTGKYFITNEYEYEIIAYLMVGPADLRQLTANLGGELFYES